MKQSATFSVFFFLVLVSLLLFFLSSLSFLQPIERLITFFTSPIQHSFYQTVQKRESREIQRLIKENDTLRKQLVDQKKLQDENNALKDQFVTNKPNNKTVLPAYVIGAVGLIPGMSAPEKLILDKGSRNGVAKGHAVVVKDTIIGIVSGVSNTLSVVSVLGKTDSSFTAKTLETHATGVVSGTENGLKLENVVLSQQLKRGDVVLTKGDIDAFGKGIPPDLIVGRIVAIDKKPSSLFQTAQLKSFVDISTVTTVFIVQQAT